MHSKISAQKIKKFQSEILKWFEIYRRVFPWREPDLVPYEIVIAEVLLQRTKAETIDKFYKKFIEKYPTWQALEDIQLDVLEFDLKPVGLYRQRAKRLKKMATALVQNNGIIPNIREEIDEISMFGQYIGNAIELQIFNRPKPLLDVNMARVLERFFGPRKLVDIRYDPYLQELSHRIVKHHNSKEISWAILDFAALICKSVKPLCSTCLLSADCKYYKLFVIK